MHCAHVWWHCMPAPSDLGVANVCQLLQLACNVLLSALAKDTCCSLQPAQGKSVVPRHLRRAIWWRGVLSPTLQRALLAIQGSAVQL